MRTKGRALKIFLFLPGICLIGYAFVYPMVRLIVISFQTRVGNKVVFAGISNFAKVLSDDVFFAAIRNNGILILIVVPVLLFICLVFSVIIYGLRKGTKPFQIIIFIPYILSIAATGVLFSYLLQQNGILHFFPCGPWIPLRVQR